MTAQKTSSKNRSYELKKLKAECVAEENMRFNTSQKFRKKGISAVEEGNKGLKATKCEVFLYLVKSCACTFAGVIIKASAQLRINADNLLNNFINVFLLCLQHNRQKHFLLLQK